MAIQTMEELLAKEMVKRALFQEAFIELAVGFCRRDRKSLNIVQRSVNDVASRLPARKLIEAAAMEAGSAEVETLRKDAMDGAITALKEALQVIAKRV